VSRYGVVRKTIDGQFLTLFLRVLVHSLGPFPFTAPSRPIAHSPLYSRFHSLSLSFRSVTCFAIRISAVVYESLNQSLSLDLLSVTFL
jgi:hypothetical protein